MRTIDDDSVPYRLLDSTAPSVSSPVAGQLGRVPVVFWVDGERIVPEATGNSCDEPPGVLVKELLDALAAGPADDARAGGRSSAIPPDAGLDLIGIEGRTADVDIEPMTSLSAERLPVAVGQVVLTATSTGAIQSVQLLSHGESVQVPLPGGALTEGPVTAEDYASLLPDRLATPARLGCPAH